ncbi:hypothetical protein ACV7JQ_07205 [Globicatella sulfidifaciens]
MKKILLLSSVLLLTACGASKKDDVSNQQSTTIATEATTATTSFEDEISSAFENKVTVEKIEDLISSDIGESHTEYEIKITEESLLNQVREANDRIYSNQATDEDKALINDIQNKVIDLASKLENEVDAIKVSYLDTEGNSHLISYSQKNNNIIPIIE